MKLLYKVLEKVGRMTFPDDDLNINKGKWMNDYLCFYRVLTFNIDSGIKYYFNDISLNVSDNYEEESVNLFIYPLLEVDDEVSKGYTKRFSYKNL